MSIQSLDAVKSSALFVQVLVSVFSLELRLQNFLCIFLAMCRMSLLLLIPPTFLSLCFVKFLPADTTLMKSVCKRQK